MELARTHDQELPTWRDATFAQGRTLSWLATKTGKSSRTIYAYSRGVLRPSDDWLATVAALLNEPVSHVALLEVTST